MKFLDIKLFRFLVVGVLNTIAGASVMFLLYNLANCSYWLSSTFNYIVGGILSFFLNKYFTFQNKQKSFRQVLLFIINLAVCYVIAYVFAKWLIYKVFISQAESIKDNIAMLCGMCIYTGLNYIGQRIFVFNGGSQNE